jgi:lipoprotein-releasing system ATP-binding protein
MTALIVKNLAKSFVQADNTIELFDDVNFEVPSGKIVSLVGESGCGKSSLLHILGLLDNPTSGEVIVNGVATNGLSEEQKTLVRRHEIGFVYQYHHLLADFSALENIMLPQLAKGVSRKEAEAKALDLLSRIGLDNRATHRPAELSGGEQQRVAIARSIANNPKIILADEPTGNLDEATANKVLGWLFDFIRSNNLAMFLVTHNTGVAKISDKTFTIKDKKLCEF